MLRRKNAERLEGAMIGILKMMRFLIVLGVLVMGGLALWRRRDTLKRTWESVGGAAGIKSSADQMMRSVGPVKDLVADFVRLK
jgi:hypothetical protein